MKKASTKKGIKRKASKSRSQSRKKVKNDMVRKKLTFNRKVKNIVQKQMSMSQKMNARGNNIENINNGIGVAAVYQLTGFTRANMDSVLTATAPVVDGTALTYRDYTLDTIEAKLHPLRVSNILEIVNTQQYAQHFSCLFYQCKKKTNDSAYTQVLTNFDTLAIDASEAKVATAELNTLYDIREVSTVEDWSCLRKTSFVLKPGAMKILKGYGRYKPYSKGISIEQDIVDTTNAYVPGCSTQWVIQVRGLPVYDSTNRGFITYGEGESSCIQTINIDYKVSVKDRDPKKFAAFAASNLATVTAANASTLDIDIQRVTAAIPANP